jgi:hypothetical protein
MALLQMFLGQLSYVLPFASTVFKEFYKTMLIRDVKEYLRTPTSWDINYIAALHQAKHRVDGHIGSLDCTHTYWKNYPSAWKDQYNRRCTHP